MKPYMIAIAGPSCTGKTTVARRIAESVPATIFGLDAYYHDLADYTYEQRCAFNFDHPDSLESAMLIEHLRGLAAGNAITRPVYDFSRHTRSGKTEVIEPNEVIIVEGLFTLHWPELLPLYGTKAFIDAGDRVCYPRREKRDVAERGRTPESIQKQYATTVRPMAEQFILPSKVHADLVLDGTHPIEANAAAILAHMQKTRKALPAAGSR